MIGDTREDRIVISDRIEEWDYQNRRVLSRMKTRVSWSSKECYISFILYGIVIKDTSRQGYPDDCLKISYEIMDIRIREKITERLSRDIIMTVSMGIYIQELLRSKWSIISVLFVSS